MNKEFVPTEGKRSCPYQQSRSPSRQLQGKAAIRSTTLLIIFLLRMGLICGYYTVKCVNSEHPELSDWQYS